MCENDSEQQLEDDFLSNKSENKLVIDLEKEINDICINDSDITEIEPDNE